MALRVIQIHFLSVVCCTRRACGGVCTKFLYQAIVHASCVQKVEKNLGPSGKEEVSAARFTKNSKKFGASGGATDPPEVFCKILENHRGPPRRQGLPAKCCAKCFEKFAGADPLQPVRSAEAAQAPRKTDFFLK